MSSKAPPRKRARVGLPPSRLSRVSPRPVSSVRSLVNRFPNELWAVILASCSAADLCCLRATHEHLRILIDEKNSKLLKEAFKRSGLPSFQSIVARWPDVDLTRIPRRYQSTGEDEAVANLYSHRAGSSEDDDSTLPTEASYWLPYLNVIGPTAAPPSRGRCVCHMRFAFDELASIGIDCRARDDSPAWSLGTLPRSIDIDNLLEDYDERAVTHEAIETIYLAIAEWRQQNQLDSAPIREANLGAQGQESGTGEIVELESDDATAIDNECEPSRQVGTSKDASSRARGHGPKQDRRINSTTFVWIVARVRTMYNSLVKGNSNIICEPADRRQSRHEASSSTSKV
ncbi:hypothetical protein K525DRAFT_245425 [Schizophyllum commune Loenen D]|nr:hypothetical protein K525DRAFT_245425 [Schizophyllum commune Loenen D]